MNDDTPEAASSTQRRETEPGLVAHGSEVLKRALDLPGVAPDPSTAPVRPALAKCSVVVPAYNEEENLPLLHARLTEVLGRVSPDYEIVFVDDGSSDGTLSAIRRLARGDPRVRYISFARNFGHEAASTAGLDRADGDVVILMDADLQDPPELIPELIEQWRLGHQVVCARRATRAGESPFKRATAWCFYRLMNALTPTPIPLDTGDFRLMDRTVVREFQRLREANRFVRGLVAWIGHRQVTVEFDRPPRHAGEAKYNLSKLAALSLDALVSFSTRPLRLATLLGGLTVAGSLAAALVFGREAWMASGLFFLGGVQMLLLGLLGEYVGRIHTQILDRPLYVVREEK